VLRELEHLRTQFRPMVEAELARHGHLLVARCQDDDTPPFTPVTVARAVSATVAALAAPAPVPVS
jgi:hypothetical protein